MKKLLIVVLVLICFLMGCKKVQITPDDPTPIDFVRVDFDEANISTVTIGNQIWMAENLKVTVDANGNRLDSRSINDDRNNDDIYGRLYTFYEAQAACPAGWHLPSIEEWEELFDTLGGIEVAGGKMKTVEYWNQPNAGATNSSGFNAVPSGGYHDGFGWACHFWSSTEDGDNAYIPSIMNSGEDVYILYDQSKSNLCLVRYIRD